MYMCNLIDPFARTICYSLCHASRLAHGSKF